MAFATAAPLEPDAALLATMESLGTQISQFVERCRAQQAVRSSDARKSAILNAAFDCIITMDHNGDVVEVNRAAERTFGYAAAEMVGRDLAELIIPPYLRDAHRRGLARYLRTGISAVGGHPLELDGHARRRQRVPGRGRHHPRRPPRPAALLRLPARRHRGARARERDLRRLADEQAALRRVATAVAAETDPRRVFGVVTEEVGAAARRPELEHGALQRRRARPPSSAAGARARSATCPSATTVRMDGDTASALVWRTGAPARIDDYGERVGELAATLRGLGFRSRGRRADLPRRAGCGAR